MSGWIDTDIQATGAGGSLVKGRTKNLAGKTDCVPSLNGPKSLLSEPSKADHSISVLVVALTAIVFILDVMIPLGTATWALYALPLGLSRWSRLDALTFIMAGACTVLIVLAHFFCPTGPSSEVDGVNRVFGVLMVWIAAFFLKEDFYRSSGLVRLDWSNPLSFLSAISAPDVTVLRKRGDQLKQKSFSIASSGANFLQQELLVRMPSISVDGVLYSARGLSFEWKTEEFLSWTSECEGRKPGAREEIIAEAHHLALWPHHFSELAFFIGTLYANLFLQNALMSIVLGLTCLVAVFHLEVIRFYSQGAAGTSRALSYVSMSWGLLKWPAFLMAAVTLWPHEKIIAVAFIVFLIVQVRLKLITEALSPLRIAATDWILNLIHGQAEDFTYITEAMSLAWVIDRWRHEQGLPPRSD